MLRQAEQIRILTLFGTRPEAIKMAPVVHALKSDQRFHHTLCVSGQHRDMLDSVLAEYEIASHIDLELMGQSESLGNFTSLLAIAFEKVIRDIRPDRVLVHGDTCTTLGGAMAAYFQKIPVGHVEAGLRSHDMDSPWPEEANRRIVGTLADLHFAPTEIARKNLLAEGVSSCQIFVTGNTIVEAVALAKDRMGRDQKTSAMLRRVSDRAGSKPIVLVTAHRRENQGPALRELCQALTELAAFGNACYVCLVHPNPDVAIHFNCLQDLDNILLLPPQTHMVCLALLQDCRLLITDSGGMLEEAAILGKQCLIFRKATERPETLTTGFADMVELVAEDLMMRMSGHLRNKGFSDGNGYRNEMLYGDGTASRQIVGHIASHHSLVTERQHL